MKGCESFKSCPLISSKRQNLLIGSVDPDLTSSVPLDHNMVRCIGDITSDCSDVFEIVHCDIGWCMSPAVAPLILGYPASAAHLDSVDATAFACCSLRLVQMIESS